MTPELSSDEGFLRGTAVFELSVASIYIYIYIYICWLIVVEGDSKASFSIATTVRCRGGTTPFPGMLHLPLIRTYNAVLSKETSNTFFASTV